MTSPGRTLQTGSPLLTLHDFDESELVVLDRREQEVLRLAFGLSGGEPVSYPAIGREFGIGRERVRQIRNRALRKLRKARAVKGLGPGSPEEHSTRPTKGAGCCR